VSVFPVQIDAGPENFIGQDARTSGRACDWSVALGYCDQVFRFVPSGGGAAWFEAAVPRRADQVPRLRAWREIAAGRHTLIRRRRPAPGRTLAAFPGVHRPDLPAPTRRAPIPVAGPQVVYVSPLKALAVDIHLKPGAPGWAEIAAARGPSSGLSAPHHPGGGADRGTTAAAEAARAMLKRPAGFPDHPPPESLYLMVNVGTGAGR